jgi:hypothetical protein
MDMKHSAYRSMQLAKEGKKPVKKGGLQTWFSEKWRNLTPLTLGDNTFYDCGEKSKEQIKKGLPSVCRPTVKVNEKTPVLAKNYSIEQIKKAVEIKKKGGMIYWSKL